MDSIVSVEWLAANLSRVHVVDARWYLPGAGKTGRAEYAAGHLPGAVFVDVDDELADPPSTTAGRHPLPSRERFEAAMARAGISDGDDVVAYDDVGGAIAARVWWLLRASGHRGGAAGGTAGGTAGGATGGVAVLDGGIQAWRAAGHEVTTEVPRPRPGSFRAVLDPARVVSRDDVDRMRGAAGVVILDARARERYAGVLEPIDARPGHIPGAKSAPFAENLTEGRFKPPAELRALYAALGIAEDTKVIAYCGSGVTACHDLLALEHAGLPPALLYAGSYSQWAAAPDLPVAKGNEAG